MERRNSLPGLTSTPRVKKFAVLEDLSGSMDASIDRVPSLGGSELSKSFAFGQGRISPLDRIRPLRPGFDGQAPDEPMSLNATMPNMPHLRHEVSSFFPYRIASGSAGIPNHLLSRNLGRS
eukprot:m.598329 g.598329  ORF g.598329 m.598329 type:complete len:121 (-) comp58075_c0_seq2:2580-2942(-)